jgi:hypothetical protein
MEEAVLIMLLVVQELHLQSKVIMAELEQVLLVVAVEVLALLALTQLITTVVLEVLV